VGSGGGGNTACYEPGIKAHWKIVVMQQVEVPQRWE